MYIPDSFLGCVMLAGPIFGVRVSRNKQVGQGSAFDLWTMCLFGLDYLRIQLSDPVTVKVVDNIGNNTLYDCWLSCWEELAMGGRDGMQTMGQYSDTPGGYIPPGQAVLSSYSDDVTIKRYGGGGGAVIYRFVHIVPLLCFGALVAWMGVTGSMWQCCHTWVAVSWGALCGCHKCRSGRGFGSLQ